MSDLELDLDRRFRETDRIPVRDLWPEIQTRPPGRPVPPSAGQRWAAGLVALAIVTAVVAFAIYALSRHETRRPAEPPSSWSRVQPNKAVFGPHAEMNAVASYGRTLVAVGYVNVTYREGHQQGDSAAAMWSSRDGRTWARVPADQLGRGNASDVVGGPDGFVAVGTLYMTTDVPDSSGFFTGVVWTSLDGRTWSRLPSPPDVFGGSRMAAVAANGGGFIAVGSHHASPAAWTSPDGITWRRARIATPDLTPGDEGGMTDVTRIGGRWVAVGFTRGRLIHPEVWTSLDGSAWTAIAFTGWLPDQGFLQSVTAGPGGLVAVGLATVGQGLESHGEIAAWASPDGLHWRPARKGGGMFEPQTPRARSDFDFVYAVTSTPSGYVAVGFGRGGAAVWTSPDGASWTRTPSFRAFQHAAAAEAGFVEMRGVMAWGSGLVAVGYDSNSAVFPADEQGAVWIYGPPNAAAGSRVP